MLWVLKIHLHNIISLYISFITDKLHLKLNKHGSRVTERARSEFKFPNFSDLRIIFKGSEP